jgi:hypothetical protein
MHTVQFDAVALARKTRPNRPQFQKQDLPWAIYLDTVLNQRPYGDAFLHYDPEEGYYTYSETPDTYAQALAHITMMESTFDHIDPTFLYPLPLDHRGMSHDHVYKRERTRRSTRTLVRGMMWYKAALQSKMDP